MAATDAWSDIAVWLSGTPDVKAYLPLHPVVSGCGPTAISPTDGPHAGVHRHGEEMRRLCWVPGGERSILLGGGRSEAERHWVIQSRPTDRSALFPGTILCCRRSRRARAAVSDFHAAQRPPPFLLNHRWWRWTLSLNAVPVWTCTRPVSFAVF